MPTLELAIDARRAVDGQRQFEQATQGVQRAAGGAAAGVQKISNDLAAMKTRVDATVAAQRTMSTTVNTLTTSVERQSAAQRTLQRAFDVTGNFAKGFITALAIGPVVALGNALATGALELLGFGEAAETAEEKLARMEERMKSLADLMNKSAATFNTSFGGLGTADDRSLALAGSSGALGDLRGQLLTGELDSRAARDRLRVLLGPVGIGTPDADPVFGSMRRDFMNGGFATDQQMLMMITDAQREIAAQLAVFESRAAYSATSPLGSFNTSPMGGGALDAMIASERARLYEGQLRGPGATFDQGAQWATADTAALYAGPAGIGMGTLQADPLRQFLAQNQAPRYTPATMPSWMAGYSDGSGAMQGPPMSEEMVAQQQAVEDLGDSISSTLSTTLAYADSWGGAMRGIFASVFSGILQDAVIKPTGQAIAAALLAENGHAFSGGNVLPFANGGVVGGPTYFPMAGGRTGLMGEAGPEAVMPLARGADGKLGVKAAGGGGVNITFNVQAADAGSFRRSFPQLAADMRRAMGRAA